MGYKQIEPNMTFAEVSLLKSMEHNRSLKRLEKINQVINWSQVEEILLSHYTVGTSREGADAYSPLMLLKGFLLQKWYRIDSDPELENQINDRISFKKFMGLSFDQHSPDHSTFSRFRGRLSKEAMNRINSVVLQQFSRKGLVINEGVAVDARLVQSASHPISNEEIKKQREKRETPEGKLDKNGNLLKFSRDLDSDWVVKKGVFQLSGARESHPRALRELDMTVSRHPAPIVQPYSERAASGQKASIACALRPVAIDAPSGNTLSIFCISGMPTEQEYCSGAGRCGTGLTYGSCRNS